MVDYLVTSIWVHLQTSMTEVVKSLRKRRFKDQQLLIAVFSLPIQEQWDVEEFEGIRFRIDCASISKSAKSEAIGA